MVFMPGVTDLNYLIFSMTRFLRFKSPRMDF